MGLRYMSKKFTSHLDLDLQFKKKRILKDEDKEDSEKKKESKLNSLNIDEEEYRAFLVKWKKDNNM